MLEFLHQLRLDDDLIPYSGLEPQNVVQGMSTIVWKSNRSKFSILYSGSLRKLRASGSIESLIRSTTYHRKLKITKIYFSECLQKQAKLQLLKRQPGVCTEQDQSLH